ncbi:MULTISPECIES: pyridoxamine 5'-phosphate oxidase family protein [unclassified Hyphomicrobium]|uniref:pyridoxamine 5'-phosphate oxidase family protein n=1 Tax=unclassified Hyphomicrobium TaxID=2619925 RepID=UPI000213F494|nr:MULTISPECIES: pyridoxamine 5'-phosphate oxidase family protein [unclassified Hyphomicrobium]CCB66742.1 putative general stress protein 26 [Hyphomicrobium sp. MC1]
MTDTKEHLHDLLKDFSGAMLTTRTAQGGLHARPMTIAKLADNEELYCATGLSSPKIAEISNDPHVSVTFQVTSEYAALYGVARVVRDRETIEKLWSETWRIWFAGGKDDADLCLLAISPKSGEYWDNSGSRCVKYLFSGKKAVLQKSTPETDDTQHAKVSL